MGKEQVEADEVVGEKSEWRKEGGKVEGKGRVGERELGRKHKMEKRGWEKNTLKEMKL